MYLRTAEGTAITPTGKICPWAFGLMSKVIHKVTILRVKWSGFKECQNQVPSPGVILGLFLRRRAYEEHNSQRRFKLIVSQGYASNRWVTGKRSVSFQLGPVPCAPPHPPHSPVCSAPPILPWASLWLVWWWFLWEASLNMKSIFKAWSGLVFSLSVELPQGMFWQTQTCLPRGYPGKAGNEGRKHQTICV